MKNCTSYKIYQNAQEQVILVVYEENKIVSIERKPLLTLSDMLNIAHHGYDVAGTTTEPFPDNQVAQIDVHLEQYGAWSEITLYPSCMSQEYCTAIGIPADLQHEECLNVNVTTYGEGQEREVIWNGFRGEKLRNDLGMTTTEADRYNVHDVAVIMEDRKTKNEALQALDKGTAVINITEEPWDEVYAEEWETPLADIKAGQVDGMSYLEYQGREYVVAYVL